MEVFIEVGWVLDFFWTFSPKLCVFNHPLAFWADGMENASFWRKAPRDFLCFLGGTRSHPPESRTLFWVAVRECGVPHNSVGYSFGLHFTPSLVQ